MKKLLLMLALNKSERRFIKQIILSESMKDSGKFSDKLKGKYSLKNDAAIKRAMKYECLLRLF